MIVLQEKETAQETFDFVVGKLREQKVPSISRLGGFCIYGPPGGVRCAVGHLMGDAYCEYKGGIKGAVDDRVIENPKYFDLLRGMQSAHDRNSEFPQYQAMCASSLVTLAKEHELDPSSAQEWYNAATQGS